MCGWFAWRGGGERWDAGMRDNTRPKNEQNINKRRGVWCDVCRKASKGIGGSFEVLNFAIENGILLHNGIKALLHWCYKSTKEICDEGCYFGWRIRNAYQ